MIERCISLALRLIPLLHGLGSLVLLAERLWMAQIFLKSGWLKVSDWNNTIFLFTNEFNVPLLPPALAAYFATAVELACPVLLIVGLGTRLATLPMLAMTAVIQFTYASSPEHAVWAMLLTTILCFGPGRIAADHWLRKWLERSHA